ncbi:conserved hypothetical protein (plasmid) [Borreliella afzelii ACA-1]|nr:conserved hypothetical protein [Borreliella afzelii ACA-1]
MACEAMVGSEKSAQEVNHKKSKGNNTIIVRDILNLIKSI